MAGSRAICATRASATRSSSRPARGCVADVLAIFGPTASGKSAVAEEVARLIPAELVSADAMQVYRGLPILTNQSQARLVAYLGLDEEGSVADYQRLAHEAIDEILAAGRLPIVVGGTGLYLRAALADLELPPPPAPGARDRLEGLYDELGPDTAHALLVERDPAAAATVHPNDRRRVVRALELVEAGSSLAPAENRLWSDAFRRPTLLVGLDVDPDELDGRIQARVEAMVARGVVAEAQIAWQRELATTARKVLGLEEFATLPLVEAVPAVVTATRRLARYQRKWLRRLPV